MIRLILYEIYDFDDLDLDELKNSTGSISKMKLSTLRGGYIVKTCLFPNYPVQNVSETLKNSI